MSFDLHTHTTCSDGSYTAEELIKLAVGIGLTGLSITDHDSITAYPEAFEIAKKHNIQLIPGVEFSCHYKEKSVHVLGYSFDYQNEAIQNLCKRHYERRANRNLQILEKLKTLGVDITEDELKKSTSGVIGRPHIAKLLIAKGHAADIAEAFKVYLGDGKKAYVAGALFTIQETLDVIHAAKGFAVLAHPHLHYSHTFVKDIMTNHAFDGMECQYSLMSKQKNAPWIEYAKKHDLLMTGGSDFHGTIKPMIPLGATIVTQEQIQRLLSNEL
jgi:predicted metal-dependent phosphoesterase TrpH